MEVLKSWCIPALRLISFSKCTPYLLMTWNRKMTSAGKDQINAFRLISGIIHTKQIQKSSFQFSSFNSSYPEEANAKQMLGRESLANAWSR